MIHDDYQKLLENVGFKAFLSKPYGLGLLFILERCELENANNGIENTYELLTHFKPRRGAFSTFIQVLEADGYIIKSNFLLPTNSNRHHPSWASPSELVQRYV